MLKYLIAASLMLAAPAYAQQHAEGTPNSPFYMRPATSIPSPCSATTVGTSATLILDMISNGTERNGGGFALPATAANGIYFSWNSTAPTTTASGTTFYLAPGGTIPFAGAPNTALYAIATANVVGSCFYE